MDQEEKEEQNACKEKNEQAEQKERQKMVEEHIRCNNLDL